MRTAFITIQTADKRELAAPDMPYDDARALALKLAAQPPAGTEVIELHASDRPPKQLYRRHVRDTAPAPEPPKPAKAKGK